MEVNDKVFHVGEGSLLALRADDCKCDFGLAARSVGFSLGPGLVALRRRAESKRLRVYASPVAATLPNTNPYGSKTMRKAGSGRIRVYDEPVDNVDKSGARRKAFRSQP